MAKMSELWTPRPMQTGNDSLDRLRKLAGIPVSDGKYQQYFKKVGNDIDKQMEQLDRQMEQLDKQLDEDYDSMIIDTKRRRSTTVKKKAVRKTIKAKDVMSPYVPLKSETPKRPTPPPRPAPRVIKTTLVPDISGVGGFFKKLAMDFFESVGRATTRKSKSDSGSPQEPTA